MRWRSLALATAVGMILFVPAGAVAQAPKVPRAGMIFGGSSADSFMANRRQALREAGYVEGETIEVAWRFSDGRNERMAALAVELVRLDVVALVAAGGAATTAARNATTKIPIVAIGDGLVAEGHVASLARPGGNVTGVSLLGSELDLKRLEVLKQTVPSATRIAVLRDPTTSRDSLGALQTGARAMGITLKILEVRKVEDLDPAFQVAREWPAQGLNVLASPLLNGLRRTIIDLAAKYRLPAIYQWPESAKDGGLMAYGPTNLHLYQLTFAQLDRVLKGTKPSDLPVIQPSEFKLALNLRTAKALGLQFSNALRMRADQVIQ